MALTDQFGNHKVGNYMSPHGPAVPMYPQPPTNVNTGMAHPLLETEGDIVVRRAENGYTIMVREPPWSGKPPTTYVCMDVEDIGSVVKLAMVNHKISKAK